jgi:MYXO-CTERM domain-containing protein
MIVWESSGMISRNFGGLVCALAVVSMFALEGLGQQPLPVGSASISIGYETTTGPVEFSGDLAWDDAAMGPQAAIALGDAPNIRAFNAINSFGRRTFAAQTHPSVLGANESLVSNGFFKDVPTGAGDDFFPDITEGSDLTIRVEGMQFDTNVTVDESTFMLHVLWNDQASQLDTPYLELHNHHTATDPFRDFDTFVDANVFTDILTPNTTLAAVSPTFSGEGTDTLDFEISVPYSILRNLEESGQDVDPGLPAPHGFLEPFHFHFEYVVVPEPGAGLLAMGLAGIGLIRRRRST